MSKNKKIAIIGAGASGLFCAIECAKNRFQVDIYEQNSKCAKKILVSGNGRCNITNTTFTQDDYFTQNPSFVKYALDKLSFKEFEKFASSVGLLLDIKNDGKVYPLSNEAKSVTNLFISHAKNLGVNFFMDTKITDIKKLFKDYDGVVIATGSEAAPHLGGNADGQKFAKEFGHNIIPTYPSLVQLHLNSSLTTNMSGAKIDGEVTLFINNSKTLQTQGDILFTDYGVSGFAILDISQMASESLMNYQAVDIVINLLPSFTTQKLSSHIMKLSNINSNMTILNILHGLIPIKIAKVVLNLLELSHSMKAKELNTKDSKKLANKILNWKFEVNDTHGFRHAEVSGGGVDVDEINPHTMESLKQPNLYFCGEVLDVVGRRGGYNFAWAWASAFVVAKKLTNKHL